MYMIDVLLYLGMESVNILVPRDRIILGLGPLDDFHVWLTFFGLIMIAAMVQRQIPGGILIGIIVLTIITWIAEDKYPSGVVSWPQRDMSVSQFIQFTNLTASSIAAPILTFLVVGVVDVGGCVLGLGAIAGLMKTEKKSNKKSHKKSLDGVDSASAHDDVGSSPIIVASENDNNNNVVNQLSDGSVSGGAVNGDSGTAVDEIDDRDGSVAPTNENMEGGSGKGVSVPGTLSAFVGCGISSMVGACLGTTPTILVIESAVGIKVGARSGLSACVVGLWFLLSLFFIPVLSHIPSTATAPVSILLGVMMMSQVLLIDWNCLEDAVPGFLTITMIPLTFSIANGIIIGIMAAALMKLFASNDACIKIFNYYKRRLHKLLHVVDDKHHHPRDNIRSDNKDDDDADNADNVDVEIVAHGISRSHSNDNTRNRALPGHRSDNNNNNNDDEEDEDISEMMRNTYSVFGNHHHPNAQHTSAEQQLHASLADVGLDIAGGTSVTSVGAVGSFPFLSLADEDDDDDEDNDDNKQQARTSVSGLHSSSSHSSDHDANIGDEHDDRYPNRRHRHHHSSNQRRSHSHSGGESNNDLSGMNSTGTGSGSGAGGNARIVASKQNVDNLV